MLIYIFLKVAISFFLSKFALYINKAMKKNIFIIAILFATTLICSAQVKIEPELQQLLNSKGNKMISINIISKHQISSNLLKSKTFLIKDSEIRKGLIIKELKSYSDKTQADIIDFLKAEESKNCVANIKSHWIANSICCEATKEVIENLAQFENIEIIGLNQEVQMICDSNESSIEQYSNNTNATPHVLQVNADDVWNLGYTGKNVVVAVLDSGTNFEHYDLSDHLWIGYADTDGDGEEDDIIYGWNFATKDANGNSNIKDDYGHGTHCAGIVCGDGTSGNTTGIAPDASLMTVKIVNRTGGGTPEQMISGVEFAVENGADILSMSLGFKNNQIGDAAKAALRKTFENVLEAGIIVCAAAGNDGNSYGAPNNVDIPASCPPPYLHPDQQINSGGLSSVVCVGAVNSNDEYASFSSQGPSTWQGSEWNDYLFDDNNIGLIRPDIVAPGDLIYSLKHDNNDKYKFNSGTSQATPCVAGVMALMLEKNPLLTPAEICEIIETTAVKLSDKKNNTTGSGRIDALNAINGVEAGEEKPFIKLSEFSPSKTAINNLNISAIMKNYGKGNNSNATTVVLSTNDPYITITNNISYLTSLNNGDEKEIVFPIAINENTPNGHTAYFRLTTKDGELEWNDEFSIEIESSALIVFNSKSVESIEAGNTISFDVEMINVGTAATTFKSDVTLSTSSSYVSIIKGDGELSPLSVDEKESVNFTINIDESIPNNTLINFDLYVTPNNFNDVNNYMYEFEIGKDRYGYYEDGFDGWTTFDASNDGRNHPWWHSSLYATHKVDNIGSLHSGKGCMMSETYCLASLIEYEVPIDNYFVSPKVKATGESKFSFWAKSHSGFYYGQHFGVAISETSNNSAESFTTIKDWTITSAEDADWVKYSVDLSEYEGKEIYVAIRHFFTPEEWSALTNGYDLYVLYVDDAMFENVTDISDNVRYDNYSYFSIKAKSAPIQAPTNLKATTIDEKSINISWNAVTNAQSYNLYRDGKFLVNVKGSTQYKDSNLKPNKEYFYAVSSVYNGAESALSESVSAKTNKADHNIAIKSISPEVLELGENELEITFINDGKYEQDSRSTITLSCSNPNVTILTNNINLNALYAGGEATKYFKVMVGDVPTTTTIEFNANVAQKFAPYYSWDCPFEIMANVPTGVEDSECDDNITSVYISGGELYVNGIEGDGRIEFFDISGKALFSSLCHEGSAIINISKYKEGIYIVRVVDNNGVKTQKIYLK